jgi:hypothetical protein
MLVCPFRWYTRTYSTSISEGNSIVAKSIVCQFAEYTWVSFGHDRRVRQEVPRTGNTQIQHNRLKKMVLAAKDDEEGPIDVP